MAELTHASQKRYPPELKARAVRMALETIEQTGERQGWWAGSPASWGSG